MGASPPTVPGGEPLFDFNPGTDASLSCFIVRPTTSITPFRAAAALSSSSRNDAASAVQPHTGFGLSKAGPRKEVPLASQEPTKGVIQYALYVSSFAYPIEAAQGYAP